MQFVLQPVNLFQAQILLNGVRAHGHHLILDIQEVLHSRRLGLGPGAQITIDGTAEFHAEIRVGKLNDFLQTFDKACTNDQAIEAETHLSVFRLFQIVRGFQQLDFALIQLDNVLALDEFAQEIDQLMNGNGFFQIRIVSQLIDGLRAPLFGQLLGDICQGFIEPEKHI